MEQRAVSADVCGYQIVVDKIRDEMAKEGGMAAVVGETLSALLGLRPELADKLGAEGKSIKGGIAELEKEARKVKTGNSACIDFWTGMQVILKYFGINDVGNDLLTRAQMAVFAPVQETPAPKKQRLSDALDIDALMEDL